VDTGPRSDEPRGDEFADLERTIRRLQDEAKDLNHQRHELETQLRGLHKRTRRLEDELTHLKNPPMIIGTLQDMLGPRTAVVKSSNGTVFQVSVNERLDATRLKPGARVAMNQDSLAIIEILNDAWDPMVSGAEMIEAPDVTYDDVAGLNEEKQLLREAIELPLVRPELFRSVGVTPPKGVLLVGPPGCGKTLLAKAVANSTNATFIRMVGSELAQKYIGEGGRLVRELFALAREKSPSIIFLDEIDAIGAKRLDGSTSGDREVQRTLMQLLAELDGFDRLEDVRIIAATNRPDILDDALLRPGRFDRIVEISKPDDEARRAILELHLKGMSTRKVDLAPLVTSTDGFSGAELAATCVEAGMIAIRDERTHVQQRDLKEAVARLLTKRVHAGGRRDPADLYA
jgi:proteasome regulatory subunit